MGVRETVRGESRRARPTTLAICICSSAGSEDGRGRRPNEDEERRRTDKNRQTERRGFEPHTHANPRGASARLPRERASECVQSACYICPTRACAEVSSLTLEIEAGAPSRSRDSPPRLPPDAAGVSRPETLSPQYNKRTIAYHNSTAKCG